MGAIRSTSIALMVNQDENIEVEHYVYHGGQLILVSKRDFVHGMGIGVDFLPIALKQQKGRHQIPQITNQ